jgi:hypothetical protein
MHPKLAKVPIPTLIHARTTLLAASGRLPRDQVERGETLSMEERLSIAHHCHHRRGGRRPILRRVNSRWHSGWFCARVVCCSSSETSRFSPSTQSSQRWSQSSYLSSVSKDRYASSLTTHARRNVLAGVGTTRPYSLIHSRLRGNHRHGHCRTRAEGRSPHLSLYLVITASRMNLTVSKGLRRYLLRGPETQVYSFQDQTPAPAPTPKPMERDLWPFGLMPPWTLRGPKAAPTFLLHPPWSPAVTDSVIKARKSRPPPAASPMAASGPFGPGVTIKAPPTELNRYISPKNKSVGLAGVR